MTAPALIALAPGLDDPRTARCVESLMDLVRSMRPDLVIAHAGLGSTSPSLSTTVQRLVRKRMDEVVIVPLILGDSELLDADIATAVAAAADAAPDVRFRVAASLGLEPVFLEVLDERMRETLREARVRELDALVMASAGSPDTLANQAMGRLARLWGNHHKLPVTAAFAAAAPPATGEAVRAFRREGKRHIAMGSLFLTPGHLHDRAAELALEAGAVAVAAPLGAHPEVARTVLARYAVGAVELVPV